MKKTSLILSAASLVIAIGRIGLAATNFVTLTDPSADAGSTILTGIAGNTVVGFYQNGAGNDGYENGFGGHTHGLIYSPNTFATLDDPAANPGGTLSYGISGSTVVGEMMNATGIHGFIYDGASYTTLDDPNAATGKTDAFGISGVTVVGTYNDVNGVGHGFSYSSGTFTTIDDPSGTTATQVYGYSDGRYVGLFANANGEFGFVYDGTKFTTLEDPLAESGSTFVHGIDGDNIVGYYFNATGYHGFLFDGTSYTTIDDPSATEGTEIFGISGNTIVGTYGDGTTPVLAFHGNGDEGFEATIPEPGLLGIFTLSLVTTLRYRRRS